MVEKEKSKNFPKKVLLLGSGALKITGNELFQCFLKPFFGFLYNMEHSKTLHFWELPDSVRFLLEENFCKKLFDSAAKGNLHALANELNVSYPFVVKLRQSVYSIDKKTILKLSELAKISLEDVEAKILSVQTRHGHKTSIPFPICASDELASLVGHVYGDGTVSGKKRQFEYSNTNENLIKEVEQTTNGLFGVLPITKQSQRISYPAIVGDILNCFGAPFSPKILNYCPVPNWIFNGKKSFKKQFLRAIFDDDGSVMFSKNYNAKGINLHWTVHESKTEILRELFLQIKEMLKEFKIYCGEPKVSRIYSKGNEKHVVMYVNITDYSSILNFSEKIGLTNGLKMAKLEKILERGCRHSKRASMNLKSSIISLLENRNLSTAFLANVLDLPKQKILKMLVRLEKQKMVERIGKVLPNRAYIWKLSEVPML